MGRKKLSLLLAAILCIGIFAGCSKANDTGSTAVPKTEGQTKNEDSKKYDPMGKYDQLVKITSIMTYSSVNDPDLLPDTTPDNFQFVIDAKEKLNIDFKWLWTAPPDQFAQKFGVAMASGDLPDVMQVGLTDLGILMDNGQIASWNEPLKYISPRAKEYLYKDGGAALKTTTVDGNVMAIPQYWDTRRELNMMMIRQDWLEELGLQVPKTTEDLVKVMRAFKEKKGAVQPFALGGEKDWAHGMSRLMQSFGAYWNGWIQKDGKLVNGNIQPEMKNALKFLNDIYKEGLVTKDFASYDTTKSTEILVSGKTGIAYGPWWLYEFSLNQSVEKDPKSRWRAYPIASAEGGVGKAIMPKVQIDRYFVINKNCKNPEAVMKLLNMYVENDATVVAKKGEKHRRVWSWCIPKYFDPFDISTLYKNWNSQIAADPKAEKKLPVDGIKFKNTDEATWAAYPEFVKWKNGDATAVINRSAFGFLMARIDPDFGWGATMKIADSGAVTYNEYYGAATETMKEKGSTLDKLTNETFFKIVMGESPIDEFDKYVSKWKSLGGDDITKEVNEWYKKNK